jgi:DegV family protein with EDD domain
VYTTSGEGHAVSESPTVLVADSDDDRRRSLGLALYGGGYEVINAVNGEEALRFTAGLDPTLVIVHQGLAGMEPLDLHSRLKATGLGVPPFLVLCLQLPESLDDLPEDSVYFLLSEGLEPARFLQQVRLLLLGRELGAELSDTIDVLYGDLTRISMADLLGVLERHRVSGHISLSVGRDAGIWVDDGRVVEAQWGVARGRKAFNRVAVLRGGTFVLKVVPVEVERVVDADPATLIREAEEERFELDEAFRTLPSVGSRLELQLGEEFFAVDFTPAEREVLTRVQGVHNLATLLDEVPLVDIEVLRAVERLHQRGFLLFKEPEHRVHVVTDSTCDLLPAVTRPRRITVVPLSVLFGTKVYKDGIDLQPDQFYKILRSSGEFPRTSPPGKGEFLEVYRRLIGSADVVSIHISRKQSLTGEHAEEAVVEGAAEFVRLREEGSGFGKPVIRVVDSKSNSVGLGLQVLFASRLAQRGLPVDGIVSLLESVRERLHFLFVVDTLEYLRKGGRIGAARALMGSLLGIKPILGQRDGEVVPVDKVRGGRRAHPRLIELLKERVKPERPVFAAIAHATAPMWAERLKEAVLKSFQVVELVESEIGPVVGAHAGPGTVGAILFQPSPEELELLKPD